MPARPCSSRATCSRKSSRSARTPSSWTAVTSWPRARSPSSSATRGSVYLEVDDIERARAVLESLPNVKRVDAEPPGLAVAISGGSRAELVAALRACRDRRRDRHRAAPARRSLPRAGGGGSLMAAVTSPPPTRPVAGHPSTPAVVRAEFYKSGRRLRTYVAYAIVGGDPDHHHVRPEGEPARQRAGRPSPRVPRVTVGPADPGVRVCGSRASSSSSSWCHCSRAMPSRARRRGGTCATC